MLNLRIPGSRSHSSIWQFRDPRMAALSPANSSIKIAAAWLFTIESSNDTSWYYDKFACVPVGIYDECAWVCVTSWWLIYLFSMIFFSRSCIANSCKWSICYSTRRVSCSLSWLISLIPVKISSRDCNSYLTSLQACCKHHYTETALLHNVETDFLATRQFLTASYIHSIVSYGTVLMLLTPNRFLKSLLSSSSLCWLWYYWP